MLCLQVIPESPFVHVSEAISDIATPLLDNVTAALEVSCWSAGVEAVEHYHMAPPSCTTETIVHVPGKQSECYLTSLAAHAQGASALAHKLPGNLIEKAFSRSLDLINPLRELERTPSQVPLYR